MKVEKEWRQRCSSTGQDDRQAHVWLPPLLEDGQEGWIFRKLVNKIRKTFYEPKEQIARGGGFVFPPAPSTDHHRDDCEACLARR